MATGISSNPMFSNQELMPTWRSYMPILGSLERFFGPGKVREVQFVAEIVFATHPLNIPRILELGGIKNKLLEANYIASFLSGVLVISGLAFNIIGPFIGGLFLGLCLFDCVSLQWRIYRNKNVINEMQITDDLPRLRVFQDYGERI